MLRASIAALACSALCGASACAARPAPPAAEPATVSASSHRREMTWEQYYAEIRERAGKHGTLVIWVNPPQVRKRSAAR